MKQLLLVGLGGFFGSIARYGLTLAGARWLSVAFPAGTFAANVLGCFFIGVLMGLAIKASWMNKELYLLLATGFCGGFTTFSTFSAENVQLLGEGNYATAITYLAGSLLAGLLAVAVGLWLVK